MPKKQEETEGINAHLWSQVLQVAERCVDQKGYVTSIDLAKSLGLDTLLAKKCIKLLAEEQGWEQGAAIDKTAS